MRNKQNGEEKKTHGEKKVCDGQRKVAIQSTHALNTIYTH